ncbi:hypothetical protein BDZ89DRAFT_1056923 [Hymenopellis radicata]|nr:hypothetical protein BDZ89DRAFT_1056923 [Hymenopellis radicata]
MLVIIASSDSRPYSSTIMSQEITSLDVHQVSTREIVFITLTALLSTAVIFAVIFAIFRHKSGKRTLKGLVLDRRSNKYVHSTAGSDSEKAANDTDYPTFEMRLSTTSLRSTKTEFQRHSHHASLSSTSKPRTQGVMLSHSRTMSSSFRAPSRRNSVDMTTTLSLQAGVQCVSRRTRQEHLQDLESKTIASTPSFNTIASEFTDSLAFQSVAGSSKTSIVTALADSLYVEDDDAEEEEEEEEQYEVQRVQTQSVEIQRGVLVACRASNVPSVLPPIWENAEAASRYSQALSTLITTISATSLASSFSIDLADFPLPPVCDPHISLGYGNEWECVDLAS